MQEPKARRFVDSWLLTARNPRVVAALGAFGESGSREPGSFRAAFGVGGLDVVHGGLGREAEDAHEMDRVGGVPGLIEDPVLA